MIIPFPFSYSSLSTWASCPHKFKLHYIDKSDVFDDNIYMYFGKLIHNVLHKHFTNEISKKDFEARALEMWKEEWFKNWDDRFINEKFKLQIEAKFQFFEAGNAAIVKLYDNLHKVFKKECKGPYKIINKEQKYTIDYATKDGAQIQLTGIIDIELENEKGKNIIVDYKSSKDSTTYKNPPMSKLYQLNLYKHIYEAHYQKEAYKMFFVVVPRKYDKIVVVPCENKMDGLFEWIDNIVWGVQNDIFYKRKGCPDCFMCEYNKTQYCP